MSESSFNINEQERPVPYDHPDFDPRWKIELMKEKGIEIPKRQEMMFLDEPLDEELQEYLGKDGSTGWLCLKHPLVFQVPYHEGMNAISNGSLKWKKEKLEEYRKKKKWGSIISVHERPFRWEALRSIFDEIGYCEMFWQLFGDVWTDTENWQHEPQRSIIAIWLQSDDVENIRKGMMSVFHEDEWEKAWSKLPESMAVQRGWSRAGGFLGYSWTTDDKVSDKFAKRFSVIHNHGAYVAHGIAERDKAYSFLEDRSEAELFIHTKDVHLQFIENVGQVGDEQVRKWDEGSDTYSYDFDGCLHDCIGDTDNRWHDETPDDLEPHQNVIMKLREQYEAGHNIAIVTARGISQVEQMLAFCRHYQIPVQRFYVTDDLPKDEVLHSLGPVCHYDDRHPDHNERAVCQWVRVTDGVIYDE